MIKRASGEDCIHLNTIPKSAGIMVTKQIISTINLDGIKHKDKNFAQKEPDSKYVRLCEPYGPCQDYLIISLL